MRVTTQLAVYLLALIASGCAAKNPTMNSGFAEKLKDFPLRPWHTRQVLLGDPANRMEYYGVQLKIQF